MLVSANFSRAELVQIWIYIFKPFYFPLHAPLMFFTTFRFLKLKLGIIVNHPSNSAAQTDVKVFNTYSEQNLVAIKTNIKIT